MTGKKGTLAVLLIAAVAGLGGKAVLAADANERFSVRGLGTTTCSKYLEQRNLNVEESDQYAHWFTGFLTAYNWLQADTYDIAPSDRYNQRGLLRYMDLYCGKNPKKRIVDAAMSFARSVYDKRVKTGS
jgi:hypothetical protein